MKKKDSRGFTLIELLVVIAIIALLLAIVMPALGKAKFVAKRVICAARLKQIGAGMKMYSDAYGGSLPDDHLATTPTKRESHTYVAYREPERFINGKLKPFRLGYLYELNYIDTPELFYCPGNLRSTAASWVYESYCNPAPWGTLPQVYNINPSDPTTSGNQWVRVGYTYFPVENNVQIDPASFAPKELALKYIRLNPNMPMMGDLIHNRRAIAHQYNLQYSLNILYNDGHVATCNDQSMFNNLTDLGGRDIWDTLDAGNFALSFYDTAYYTVFRAIGPQ